MAFCEVSTCFVTISKGFHEVSACFVTSSMQVSTSWKKFKKVSTSFRKLKQNQTRSEARRPWLATPLLLAGSRESAPPSLAASRGCSSYCAASASDDALPPAPPSAMSSGCSSGLATSDSCIKPPCHLAAKLRSLVRPCCRRLLLRSRA